MPASPATAPQSGPGADPASAPAGADGSGTGRLHRNEVCLLGRVAADPVVTELPSGDHVSTLRLVVERPDHAGRRGSARVDTVVCAAWTARLRRTVARWTAGDVVEVTGALRRRFWRSPAGAPQSRYEVELATARRVTRAPR